MPTFGIKSFLAVGASLLLAGCQEQPVQSADRVGPNSGYELTAKPLTIFIEFDQDLRDQIRRALEPAAKQSVRLAIQGVVPPTEETVIGFRIFVNKPEAGYSTSDSDAHFASAIAFQPSKPNLPQGFYVDLKPTLTKLADSSKGLQLEKPLAITFVPAIRDDLEPPRNLQIHIDSVMISVPHPFPSGPQDSRPKGE